MLIINQENLQAFINRETYDGIEKTPFVISFVIQINGKIRTTYAHIYTIDIETYRKKHKNNDYISVDSEGNYIIDDERELGLLINTLHNLGYNIGDSTIMRDKITQYISKFYK